MFRAISKYSIKNMEGKWEMHFRVMSCASGTKSGILGFSPKRIRDEMSLHWFKLTSFCETKQAPMIYLQGLLLLFYFTILRFELTVLIP